MNERAQQLAGLIDIESADDILGEIRTTIRLVFPDFDFSTIDRAAHDVRRLFRGEYPGFRACNVRYHDLDHTMAVTLAVTRLLHGAVVSGVAFSEKDINIGVISALMHDTGYIQDAADTDGTGAKYTLTHIGRSIDFIRDYFRDDPLFGGDIETFRAILACTGVFIKIDDIDFATPHSAVLGRILGTGDLLGQMADRNYLEKLHYLYNEFVEGGIEAFSSPLDLLDKTRDFYQSVLKRFAEDFDNVHLFAQVHFRERWGVDQNLYLLAAEENIAYLDHILTHHADDYRRLLRRQRL